VLGTETRSSTRSSLEAAQPNSATIFLPAQTRASTAPFSTWTALLPTVSLIASTQPRSDAVRLDRSSTSGPDP
jgi:hypothetical protein